jgi:Spy/CpxP family protein refolding chaperone
MDDELQILHEHDAYPIFGQLLDDDNPSGRQAAEALEEFQKQMQETERKNHKRRKHLEQFRLLKLLELLDLDESQEVQFMKSFTSIRRELRRVDDDKRETLDQLASGLHAGDIADDKIYDLLDKIVQVENQKRMSFDHFLEESRSFLTAQQVAKLVIFHERFEYELLEKVKQFRDRPEGPDRPDGPGRPGRGRGPGGLSDG